MEELLQAPTKGYGEAIVIPKINADHFEIKTNLLQLVQANPNHGFEKENPHTHINNFKRITSTLKFRDVPNDVIKLMMFPYSLEGAARVWYDKEPPNSILTWEDLEMLKACPHHEFMELTQIDTFYNGLNENDQDSLNTTAGGNLLSKTTREALNIIENKSKVRYSQNKPNVSRMNTNSRENSSKMDDRIDKLADQISTQVVIVSKKVVTPATVKVVEESCVICGGSTAHIQPPVVPIPKPDIPKTLPKPNIPYPSRLNDYKLREKATNQMEKFFHIFQDLHFDISFVDALILMPKFASTIKSLLANKDKLFELAKIPLNENCSAMLLKNLPEKLKDPDKFLISCDFPGMDVCHALADLGASINLMPLSIWKKISLPELTPTQMTLELANRSITRPKGVAEDVFIKVGKIGRALIDVYGEEITLRVNDKAVTFNLNQTTRYPSTYVDMSVNRIGIIDVAREEYAQEVLGFSKSSLGGNPTPTSEPIISDSSPSRTRFEGSDFVLEEIKAYLKDDSVSSEINHVDCDPEGDKKNYFQFPVDPQDQEKTTFTRPYGTFAYQRMPFGLCNAPGTFQRCMMAIFDDMIEKTIEVFMDDFSVMPVFTDCIDAFETLKKKLTEAPILVVPDWNLHFELMCDTSDFVIGAVLRQRKTKHFQPIHYASKTMTEAQIHYTTTEKEMLAVVYAFEKFRPYLVLSKSIVYTDPLALKYLLSKQDAKPGLLQWVLILQEIDIIIHDKKGTENLAADHLSRLENPHKDVFENKDCKESLKLI
nr:reverse transcriptase domain-containing protein [Tanacetum cinerariifolium]